MVDSYSDLEPPAGFAIGPTASAPAAPAAESPRRVVAMPFFSPGKPATLLGLTATHIALRTVIPPDAEVFSGHYPDFAILPGVMLIDAALQAIERHAAERAAPPPELCGIRALRLLAPVLPGDLLEVSVELTAARQLDHGAEQLWEVNCRTQRRAVAELRLSVRPQGSPDTPGAAHAGPAETAAPATAREAAYGAAEVLQRLPHRPPLLLVDRVTARSVGERLTAVKAVSLNEAVFRPLPSGRQGAPVPPHWPRALQVESFVQAAALLFTDHAPPTDSRLLMLLGSLADVRLGPPVAAGDLLEHTVRLERSFGSSAVLVGESRVEGIEVASFGQVLVALRPAEVLRTS